MAISAAPAVTVVGSMLLSAPAATVGIVAAGAAPEAAAPKAGFAGPAQAANATATRAFNATGSSPSGMVVFQGAAAGLLVANLGVVLVGMVGVMLL